MQSHRKLSFRENMERLGASFSLGWSAASDADATLANLVGKQVATVGSGASRTLAVLAAQALRGYLGVSAASVPPYALRESWSQFDAAVVFTASGDNIDARAAVDYAIAGGYDPLWLFTQNPSAPVLDYMATYKGAHSVVGQLRDSALVDREGFLGMTSLVEGLASFCRVLSTGADLGWSLLPDEFARSVDVSAEWVVANRQLISQIGRCEHVVALSGLWTRPVVVDLESKWVEGGLGWLEVSDFRNYSHGRYINVLNRPERSGFILFSSSNDRRACDSIRRTFGESVPVIDFRSKHSALLAAIELFPWMLQLYGAIADERALSVTSPTVPTIGRGLFAGSGTYPHLDAGRALDDRIVATIELKQAEAIRCGVPPDDVERLVAPSVVRAAFALAVSQDVHSLALDFDGTLVGLGSGDDVPDLSIRQELERLLLHGINVGIFTGRGRSVVRGLRRWVSPDLWDRVAVFLYNGGVQWDLRSDHYICLSEEQEWGEVRGQIALVPDEMAIWIRGIEVSSLGVQLTIHVDLQAPQGLCDDLVILLSERVRHLDLAVASSGRSIDVFPNAGSKDLALRRWLAEREVGREEWGVLRIGDRGDRYGNDFRFLDSVSGFSVDRFSWAPGKCFPAKAVVLSEASGPSLTAQLLRSLVVDPSGLARFELALPVL